MTKLFHYSNQIEFRNAGQVLLGVMVWDESDLRYFAAPGEEPHAHQMTTGWADYQTHPDRTLSDWLAYFRDTGGGGYKSFAVPEECETDTFEDAARIVAAKYSVTYVIPEPVVPQAELDEATVIAFLEAAEFGAEIELLGPSWHARDLATFVGFFMGIPTMQPPNVFAYIPFPLPASPRLPNTRFFVTRLERSGDAWHLHGRSGVMDCPAAELVVRPASGKLREAIRQERSEIPAEVRARLLNTLRDMTNPLYA